MVSLALKSCRPIVVMSLLEEGYLSLKCSGSKKHLPAMEIAPLVGSIILKRAKLRLDLPAPVRPTMPTWRNSSDFCLASGFTVHLFVVQNIKVEVLQDTGQFRSVLGGISDTDQFAQKSGRNYHAPIKLDLSC